jgi:KDO2-lipid IV(A) lauroyltransferase
MNWLLVIVAAYGAAFLQALPLMAVARLGRAAGSLAWWIDGRHRRVALDNLKACFGSEYSPGQLRELARENFRRIGENFACAIKTSAMSQAQIDQVLQIRGLEHWESPTSGQAPSNRIVAIGHFGNFELFTRVAARVPGYQLATTYRAVQPIGLNRVLQSIRGRSGCHFFERRFEAGALRNALHSGNVILGLLSDQHGGHKGVWGRFLGRDCSTTPAPASFALRYRCPLFTASNYRTSLGQWCIEIGPRIPTHDDAGHARSIDAITGDINTAFEVAVRRDLANWFWVHRRWKSPGRHTPQSSEEDERCHHEPCSTQVRPGRQP